MLNNSNIKRNPKKQVSTSELREEKKNTVFNKQLLLFLKLANSICRTAKARHMH